MADRREERARAIVDRWWDMAPPEERDAEAARVAAQDIAAALREVERDTVERCAEAAAAAVPPYVERYSWPEDDYVCARSVLARVVSNAVRSLLTQDTDTTEGTG